MRKILCDRCKSEIRLEAHVYRLTLMAAQEDTSEVREVELDEDCFRAVEKLLANYPGKGV